MVATQYKLVMLGNGFVGKSCITSRFINENYADMLDPTIQESYRKQIEKNGRYCMLEIFDTAGAEALDPWRDQEHTAGDGFILVFAINDRKSFEQLSEHVDRIKQLKNKEVLAFLVVGSKSDLETERTVPMEDGLGLAKRTGPYSSFLECSAKDNTGITTVYESIIDLVDKYWKDNKITPVTHGQSLQPKRDKCSII
jgi:small GTP-binding protein